MTTSNIERQTVLDIIYSSLSNPNAAGNWLFPQLLTNAKDGYFSLNLLKGMVTELNDYPLAYLQHCINYEVTHHSNHQRLELDPEKSKVRISKQTSDAAIDNESDAFGFLFNRSSPTIATTEEEEDITRKRPRSVSLSPSSSLESDSPIQKQQKQSSGTYFTPYQPTFNFKALADDKGSMDILPVFYDDGKFYQDASFFNASVAEKVTKATPSYDKLDILPIGATLSIGAHSTRSPKKEKACWNCGSADHELSNCPEPTNRQQVEVNRALFLAGNDFGGGGRYYEELQYKDHVSGLEPGRLSDTLRDALGMYRYDDEPPYYRRMRVHGYPPGYTGSYADQERVMKLVGGNQLDEDVPDLQIFDLGDSGADGDDDKTQSVGQELQDTKGQQQRIRMVTYPGLYHNQETAKHEQQGSYYQQQQQESYYQQPTYPQQQQQKYRSSSYRQKQQTQQHYYEQYAEQQQHPSYHQYEYQVFSSYQHHDPQSSLSHYYQQSYYSAYDSNGQQPTHHQYQSLLPYNLDNSIPPPPPPPSNSIDDDIPPPPPPSNSLYDIPPPPPPSDNIDDDIPPPPPPSNSIDDDIPPPPPPSNSIDDDIPHPPPPSNSLYDIPPPPPLSNSLYDDILHPPPPPHPHST